MQVLLVLFVLGWVASLPAIFWWIVWARPHRAGVRRIPTA